MPRLPDIRQCLIVTGAVVLIILAVSFSLLRAALPYASEYRADLEQQISAQLGLPVSIASLDAGMDWFTPRLILLQPVVYQQNSKQELIRFDEIELSLAWFDSLRFLSPMLGEINLMGGDLTIVRNRNKRWTLQGMELADEGDRDIPDSLRLLLENANFALIDSHLVIRDEAGEYQTLELQGVNIVVENFLGEHDIRFEIDNMGRYAESLQLGINFSGSINKLAKNISMVYANVRNADIEVWRNELHVDMPYRISGEHDIELWLNFDKQKLRRLALNLASRNINITQTAKRAASWGADSLALNLLWSKQNESWRGEIRDFQFTRADSNWTMPANAIIRQQADRFSVSADYLQLHDVSELLAALVPREHSETLTEWFKLQPGGQLYNLYAAYDGEHWRQAVLQFTANDLSLNLTSLMPMQPVKIQGIDAQVAAQQGRATITVNSDALQLTMSRMFRQPLSFDALTGEFALELAPAGWSVSSDRVVLHNDDISTVSRIVLRQPEAGNLFADIQTDYQNARGAAASRYYPVSEMSPELVAWLDQAISNGIVKRGGFLLYGEVTRFPFKHDGVMQAEFTVSDMDLQYQQGWPRLRNVGAQVLFDNTALSIDKVRATTFNSKVEDAVVRIPDLYKPVLSVDGKVRAPAADLQKFIWQSPLDESLGAAMNQLQLAGDTTLNLAITLPLDSDEDIQVSGAVGLNNNTIRYPELAYELRAVTGMLHFTDETLHADKIEALLDGDKLTINVAAPETDPDILRFDFNGRLQIDSLLRRFDWMADNWFDGRSDWQVTLDVPTGEASKHAAVQLTAKSDLNGVSIHLSDALQKIDKQSLPVSLRAEIAEQALDMTLQLPDDNEIDAQRHNDGNWYVVAETGLVKGIARFHESLSPDTTVTMQLDRVELSKLLRSTDGSDAFNLKPATLPSLDITTGPLNWQKWKFNSARLQASSHRLGMVIDELKLQGADLEIEGQGSWLTSWRHAHETTLKLTVYSSNLGNALAGLGYQRIIDRCEQQASIDWAWNAEPYRFSWDKLTGTAKIEMNDGEVTEIDPGAGGRVLGLLNVFHLPSRLFLSFGDVYKKGFVFDTINGDFTFADGNAFTSNTEINASSADVRIQGRIGMQAQDYDLTVRVKPKTSAATFTGGAIAGGPVVGAGLVLLQKLLGIDKAAQDRYTITGSWDDPVITQIEKADTATQTTQAQEESADQDDIDE